MSVSYGFYSALHTSGVYDRIYQSGQMSKLFDGLILDGVYLSSKKDDPINKQFMVSADTEDMNVKVAPGRAWFLGTFTVSDSDIVLEVGSASATYDRIDAVVIEVNTQMTGYDPDANTERFNSIKIVTGTPAATPVKPVMVHEDGIDQFPIAYITVRHGSTSIRPYDLQYVVGIETPYFAWLCEKLSIAELYSKWKPILDTQTMPFIKWFAAMQRMLGNGDEDYDNIVDEIGLLKDDDYVAGYYPKVDEQSTTFSGTGDIYSFTIVTDSVVMSIADIFINGEMVYNYTFDKDTKTITFESAPPSGTNNIVVYYVVDAETYTIYFEEVQ